MVLTYATTDDLEAEPWSLDPLPADASRLLALASGMVRDATVAAVYATNTDGTPSDDVVAAGFRDAVCAQVSTWAAAGLTAAEISGGIATTAPVASKSLGPRSISYAGAEQSATDRRTLLRALTGEAVGYLRELSIWPGVQVTG